VLRGHLDVGHDHVGPVRVGQPDQVTCIGCGADDFKTPVIENADDALANERLILADDDAYPLSRTHAVNLHCQPLLPLSREMNR
jgi:hypothetical protein